LLTEIIGIIASIIGIVGFVWVIIKFVFINRKRDYKDVNNIIDEHFAVWKRVNFSSRGNSLINYKDFKKVNKFRSKLVKNDKDKMAFLMRCAVQNGMGGAWGHWLVLNKNNEKIVTPLILALDGMAGYQPRWRSAYILEKTFGKSINQVFEKLDTNMKKNEDIKFVFHVMFNEGVEKYLQNVSKGTQKELKLKAQRVLQEIEVFFKEVNQYIKEQTISILISGDIMAN